MKTTQQDFFYLFRNISTLKGISLLGGIQFCDDYISVTIKKTPYKNANAIDNTYLAYKSRTHRIT